MRKPADRDDHEDASQQHAHPGHQADLGLDVFVFQTGGKVGPAEKNEQAEAAEHAADDGQSSGSLPVCAQIQQGFKVLALLLASTLHHTGGPQALLTPLLTHREEEIYNYRHHFMT